MLYGLIGENVQFSFSKQIHKNLHSPSYELWSLSKEHFLTFLKQKNFNGINVTIPYKEVAIQVVDEVDSTAKTIGSINTIIKKDQKLIGYNTDYLGFEFLLDTYQIPLENKKIIILGSGGTAKTVAYVAKKRKCKSIAFVSREKKENGWTYEDLKQLQDYEILINTTPNGMKGKEEKKLVDFNIFNHLEWAIDLIYNPLKTSLLLEAESKNIKIASGLLMLVAQAFYSEELFQQQTLDTHKILEEYQKLFLATMNIVLIGMPGAGKTTITKLLSNKWNKEYLSIDQEIEKKEQLPIKEIFLFYGEKHFRDIEQSLTQQIGLCQGKIIDTGGGIVLNESNIFSLKKNGILVYIDRGLDNIQLNKERPLAQNYSDLKQLYQQRKDRYERYCDIKIDNNLSIHQVLEKIQEAIYAYTHFKWS